MALPKLNVPVYETILPSTEKVIKFRPFLVKEEKILLTAMENGTESSMMIAIKNIIQNCVQGNIDVDKLPLFDIEYIFLQLRSKSVGEKSKIGLKCVGCEDMTEIELDMESIKVNKPEGHIKKIMIDDNVGVMMSYPVIKTGGIIEKNGMEITKNCIDMIFTGEETHERDSFTDKELDDFLDSMEAKQFAKIGQFFETMPKLQHKINFTCVSCSKENSTVLEGIESFFASA
jgi:hypothetical protein|tara:strand:- start:1427 stop:2119 length:693 start_codon:yes stop_codon:yes gene_type:complete